MERRERRGISFALRGARAATQALGRPRERVLVSWLVRIDRFRANARRVLRVGFLLSAALAAEAQAAAQTGPVLDRPTALLDEGYVGPDACRECHAENHASWSASYHRRMTQVATKDAVLAPVGRTPELEGTAWELERRGEKYFVTPLGPAREGRAPADGEPIRDESIRGEPREVVLTTGSHHYQVYWLAARPGLGMDQLPLVWHVADARWVPRKSMFLVPPARESGSETGRWESSCIKCHATNGTEEHSSGGTRVAAFGISCEACHGPGAAHVAWHRDPARGADDPVPPAAELVHPGLLPKERSAEVCAQCHAVRPLVSSEERRAWSRDGFSFRPGDALEPQRPLLRGRRADNPPALQGLIERTPGLLEEYFWPDGEVRVSGREFNGLVESACYQRGAMTCLSCHEMHPPADGPRALSEWANDQLSADGGGPGACLACHADLAAPERLREHAHHEPGSSGSNCLDCHMPYTTYGLTKAIRSHRISSPSAGVELATGRPSACTLCHLDRPLAWTAQHLGSWYEQELPALEPERKEVSAAVLLALTGDAGQRALMAWAFGWAPAREASGTGWMPYVLSTLAMDPYDAVRWIAVRTLRLDERYRDLQLDFTREIEEQRNVVRESVLSDWLRGGLAAPQERRSALLLRPDGTLDEERFRRIYARRDNRALRLSE